MLLLSLTALVISGATLWRFVEDREDVLVRACRTFLQVAGALTLAALTAQLEVSVVEVVLVPALVASMTVVMGALYPA